MNPPDYPALVVVTVTEFSVIVVVPVVDIKYRVPPLLFVAFGVVIVVLVKLMVTELLTAYPIPPLPEAVVG